MRIFDFRTIAYSLQNSNPTYRREGGWKFQNRELKSENLLKEPSAFPDMWYCHRSRSEKWKSGAMASRPVRPMDCSRNCSSSNLASTSWSDRDVEAGLAGEQDAFRADRELQTQPEQAEHVGDSGRRESLRRLSR